MSKHQGDIGDNDQSLMGPSSKMPRLDDVQAVTLQNRLYLTKVADHPPRFNGNALSLRELLGAINPKSSIHFNFMVDIEWLLMNYPSKSSPITIIIGEDDRGYRELKRTAEDLKATNLRIGQARLPLPYGTHHTKLSMFKGHDDGTHVVISTANLLSSDWEQKTQEFYHCCGSATSNDRTEEEDIFGSELAEYLNFYVGGKDWKLIEPWRELVIQSDFRAVKARIVSSVPGSHKGAEREKYGHMRLRNLLQSLNLTKSVSTYHAQFSSIGSLGSKPELWLGGQFLSSLAGGKLCAASRLKLIYPCVEDVRCSHEGYLAANSLPYRSATAKKQVYLSHIMYKWRCEKYGRSHVMPHVKSYAAFQAGATTPHWLLITSANLSKAAWGELQKRETQLTIRSYELGVLVFDDVSLSLLPYDLPLVKYGGDDRPWVYDMNYSKLDCFGITWPPTRISDT